ncbi:MAG: type IV pilus modification protein PilV [Gammaproteobacteria bacterium]
MLKLNAQACNGFTLVEVLVAVLVLSFGLLGMAGLQVYSLASNHSAYLRSQATVLAYDIVDRMRANPEQAEAGAYDIDFEAAAPATSVNCESSACTGADMAAFDLGQWLLGTAGRLPNGDGEISRNGSIFIVAVRWTDRDVDIADGTGADPVVLQVSTEL